MDGAARHEIRELGASVEKSFQHECGSRVQLKKLKLLRGQLAAERQLHAEAVALRQLVQPQKLLEKS